ncbi:MAG: DnaB-like helicase C-terminal domain-containing protein [Bacteroidales bacterium]
MIKYVPPENVTFSPQQASILAIQSVENRRDSKVTGINTGITDLDRVLLPMRPGELISVMAFTSNYKTGLMSFIAKKATEQIKPLEGEIVVYLSWEQSVEEQTLLDISFTSAIDAGRLYKGNLSEKEWKDMMIAAVERSSKPLWLIGHSESSQSRRPRLNMTDVAMALGYLVDVQQKKPKLIILDYLQRINRDDCQSNDIRVSHMEVVDRAKDMSLAFNAPVMLGTQAGRQILERKWKIPNLGDSLESSNLEQSSDKVISLWYPKTTEPIGEKIKYSKNIFFEVTENLLLLNIAKQKYERAPFLLQLYVMPGVNQIYGTANNSTPGEPPTVAQFPEMKT